MKYKVVLIIDVSKENLKDADCGHDNMEQFVIDELGWSGQSFDEQYIESIDKVR